MALYERLLGHILLHDVGQLVRQQGTAPGGRGGVPACTKNDMVAGSEGQGLYARGGGGRARIVMNFDLAEVVPEALSHIDGGRMISG